MPDRFSEDEARRIFARAAERQHKADSRPEGLSLAELQEIARASGIDPDHVSAAVADVRGALPDHEPRMVLGVDLEPRASRIIPGELSDADWAEVVARLRRTFRSKGIPTEVGPVREWSSGATSNLLVTAAPVEGGTRVTLESSRAHEFKGSGFAGVFLGALAVFFVVGTLIAGEYTGTLFTVGVSAVLSLSMYLWVRFGYGSWSRKRSDQFDTLLDQIELVARSSAASRSPAVDLDVLGEAPAVTETRPRGRVRA